MRGQGGPNDTTKKLAQVLEFEPDVHPVMLHGRDVLCANRSRQCVRSCHRSGGGPPVGEADSDPTHPPPGPAQTTTPTAPATHSHPPATFATLPVLMVSSAPPP